MSQSDLRTGAPDVKFGIAATDAEATVMSDSNYDAENNKLLINWTTPDGEAAGDTTFATFKVKVADDAEAGSFLPITATINPNNVFDFDMNNIDFNQIDGGIDVVADEGQQGGEQGGENNPNNPQKEQNAFLLSSLA